GDDLEPRLVAERDHVAKRADHPQAAVTVGRRRAEGAASRVAVQQSLLHEHVQGLADGRPADVEPRAKLGLGLDPLALPAQVAAQGLGDLEIPRDVGTVIHHGSLRNNLSRHLSTAQVARQRSCNALVSLATLEPMPGDPVVGLAYGRRARPARW